MWGFLKVSLDEEHTTQRPLNSYVLSGNEQEMVSNNLAPNYITTLTLSETKQTDLQVSSCPIFNDSFISTKTKLLWYVTFDWSPIYDGMS